MDYSYFGKDRLERLKRNTAYAKNIQEQQLLTLLEKNKGTTYGKKYGFGQIRTIKEYQEKVPLSEYGDYEADIGEMLKGKENLLTAEHPVYYCISSGSTSEPKYLPVTTEDMLVHYDYLYGAIFGMVEEYYTGEQAEDIFGTIFQLGEFVETYTDRGIMEGIRSSALYQWLNRDGKFDASDYTCPKEILFPGELMDFTYVKVRFALAHRDVKAIHSVFAHHVVGVVQYILNNWELLLADMEQGTVDESVPLSPKWRDIVNRFLPPNPFRAAELRMLSPETLPDNIIKKIWKETRYILAIGGSTQAIYADRLKGYAGDIPVHHFVYGSSEGMMAVAHGLNRPDAYILIPDAGFFEFLPEGGWREENTAGKDARPLTITEVKEGKRYEVVYTNHSGLYRYQMGDVIRIEGFYNEAPLISFCYRKNQLMNIADEKTNTEQLEQAVEAFEKITFMDIAGYCVQEDHSVFPGRYLVYLECGRNVYIHAEKELEACLCMANYAYKCCRKMEEIGHLKLAYLRLGAFERYKQYLASKGYEMGQSKPVKVLASEDSKRFFLDEIQ